MQHISFHHSLIALMMLCLPAATPATAQVQEMEVNIFEMMKQTDKAVVVTVHTGSQDPFVLERYRRFNSMIKQAYPNYEHREAWTSREMISACDAMKASTLHTPDELLNLLAKDGYTHVLLQSSCLANDTEMQSLRHVVDNTSGMFKQIRLGEPLLSSTEDYEDVVNATTHAFGNSKTASLIILDEGEGDDNAQLALLDYVFKDKGLSTWYVGTTDGYPSFDSLIRRLKHDKMKKVRLIPFSFNASSITISQSISTWAEELKKAGCKVTAESKNVCDLDEIITIMRNHCKHAEEYRKLTAKEMQFIRK